MRSAALPGLILGQILAQPVQAGGIPVEFGNFDTVGKLYIVATVEGAAQGMRDRGWNDAHLVDRLRAQIRRQTVQMHRAMAPVREKARAEALEGRWNEAALTGYLSALEAPENEWRAFAEIAREAGNGSIDEVSLAAAIDMRLDDRAWGRYRDQAIALSLLVECDAISIADTYQGGRALPADYVPGDPFIVTAALRRSGAPIPLEDNRDYADLGPGN